MSRMQIGVDLDDKEKSRREQLLALCKLRRGMERGAPAARAARNDQVAITNAELARALHELIEALDRRVPRVERAGEASIARDARLLRASALKRLEELEDRPTHPSPIAGTSD